jgi:hypothetical protein
MTFRTQVVTPDEAHVTRETAEGAWERVLVFHGPDAQEQADHARHGLELGLVLPQDAVTAIRQAGPALSDLQLARIATLAVDALRARRLDATLAALLAFARAEGSARTLARALVLERAALERGEPQGPPALRVLERSPA